MHACATVMIDGTTKFNFCGYFEWGLPWSNSAERGEDACGILTSIVLGTVGPTFRFDVGNHWRLQKFEIMFGR